MARALRERDRERESTTVRVVSYTEMAARRRRVENESLVSASVRPDGSLRRERRVRPGFTPHEESDVYVPPARRRDDGQGELRPKQQQQQQQGVRWQRDDGGVLEEARRQVSRSAAASSRGEEWYERTIDELIDKQFWIDGVEKSLSIEDGERRKQHRISIEEIGRTDDDDDDDLRQKIIRSGIARLKPRRSEEYNKLIAKLRDGIQHLHARGLDASWILVFDEAWQLASIVGEEMRRISRGRNLPCYDMLAWRVEPGAERSDAFSPHRDRQPDDVHASFYSDDRFPKYATVWVGLANATPDSSCLYCLPVDADAVGDEGYYDGDDEDVSPLDKALAGHKERFQNVRALPCEDGEALLFSHRLLHWGSRGVRGEAPRMSISFGFSDPDFEKPYLRESNDPPAFHVRVGLVAAQLISYYQRFDVYSAKLRRCRDLFMREASHFDDEYYRKLMYETASALTLTHRAAMTAVKEKRVDDSDDALRENGTCVHALRENEDEDELDIAMQTMLDAQKMGYDDFDDDYDDEDEVENGNGANESARDDEMDGRKLLRVRRSGVGKSTKRRKNRPRWFSFNGMARVRFLHRSPVGKASLARGLFGRLTL